MLLRQINLAGSIARFCTRKIMRGWSLAYATFSPSQRIFRTLPPPPAGFPRTWLRLVRGQVSGEFFVASLRIALAGYFSIKRAVEHRLDADHEQDAPHLPSKRGMRFIGGPAIARASGS